MWRRSGRDRWAVDSAGLEGEARVIEVSGGYRARIVLKDTGFGMTLMDEREFFESRKDAVAFVEEKIGE